MTGRSWCALCGVAPRSMAAHTGTLRHKRLSRRDCRATTRRIRPVAHWARALRLNEADFITPEQAQAAEAWARGDTL